MDRHQSFDDLRNLTEGRLVTNRIGTPGFSYPKFQNPMWVDIDEEGIGRLKDFGITIGGPSGLGNRFLIDQDMKGVDLKVSLNGRKDNAIVLGGPRQNTRGRLWIGGDSNVVIVSETGVKPLVMNWEMHATRSAIFVGPGATAGGLHMYLEGDQDSVQIGDDCQFSWGVWLRTADSHAIFDVETGEVINSPKAITIGPHVWLGQDVLVMGGAKIGAGAIVGARAVVTGSLQETSIAVGTPARVVRSGVSWSRSTKPTDDHVGELRRLLAKFAK